MRIRRAGVTLALLSPLRPPGAGATSFSGEYPTPTVGSGPQGIAAGPDGALWFTESGASKIGRVTTAGAITEYAIPTANSGPIGIVTGPDGALWFTEVGPGKIGRITTSGVIAEYALPDSSSRPWGIAAGPDGALWFTEQYGNKIGRITVNGARFEYGIPTAQSFPWDIAAGPGGALWFTEYSGNQIGRIAVGGAITEYAIPNSRSIPGGIVAGPDGGFWFAEDNANAIGRLVLGPSADAYTTAEETPLTVAAPGVLGNDDDPQGDPLTATLVSGPTHGTLTLNADGSFTYAPAADYNGPDQFTYRDSGSTASPDTAIVSLTVTPVNDAPVAKDDAYTTAEDAPLTVAAPGILGNDSDADADPLTATLVAGPAHGTLALNADGSFIYTPSADYNGPDRFTYKANDGPVGSNIATVALTGHPGERDAARQGRRLRHRQGHGAERGRAGRPRQ